VIFQMLPNSPPPAFRWAYRYPSFEGGVPNSVARKTGKAAMVGKIESLGGNLGDIAWIDEAGLA
jgi:hypothetical protein